MISRPLSGWQARTTCSTSERPPARCNTFASADFRRVPFPAVRITMTTSEFAINTLSTVHADLTTNGGAARCEWGNSAILPGIAVRSRQSFLRCPVYIQGFADRRTALHQQSESYRLKRQSVQFIGWNISNIPQP